MAMAPVKTNIEQALETMKASGLKYTKKRELL
ncbi:MAG: transcriptional repressor, partial [Enterococcus faecalis]|nr:transcriptional repressor [Enterococcus faecalis]